MFSAFWFCSLNQKPNSKTRERISLNLCNWREIEKNDWKILLLFETRAKVTNKTNLPTKIKRNILHWKFRFTFTQPHKWKTTTTIPFVDIAISTLFRKSHQTVFFLCCIGKILLLSWWIRFIFALLFRFFFCLN